ncbi:MAG: hypothetical protein ABSD13_06925 [Candidatus Korobacteraceae bacterium]
MPSWRASAAQNLNPSRTRVGFAATIARSGYGKLSWLLSCTASTELRVCARRDLKCHQTRTNTAIATATRATDDNTRIAKRSLMITEL